MNNFVWLPFKILADLYAINLKNPTSSKNIDSTVIEINKTNIFNGFILLSAVNALTIELIETELVIINIIAPITAIGQ